MYFFMLYLSQGSQTRGPPDAFARPANTSKNAKGIKFNLAYFESFACKLRPAKAFLYKLWLTEHFFPRIWRSDQFEFETPALPQCQGLRLSLLGKQQKNAPSVQL
jgi:hypothetical protein